MAENDAEGAGTKAKRILREVTYPHNIHPAMVPGVSVEDQKIRYRVDKPMLTVVGGLVVAFILWGVLAPEQVFDVSSTALDWIMTNLGWVFTMIAVVLFFILLVLAFSKYGRIPLGLDDEKPEYSTLSWAAMLFAAGIVLALFSLARMSRSATIYPHGRARMRPPAKKQSRVQWCSRRCTGARVLGRFTESSACASPMFLSDAAAYR